MVGDTRYMFDSSRNDSKTKRANNITTGATLKLEFYCSD